MIFKNNEKWDGWKADLEAKLGKNFKLTRDASFEISSRYSTQKRVGKVSSTGKVVEAVALRTTFATQVSIPLESTWIDENGESCIIRWAERADKVPAGKGEFMTQFTPENLPTRGRSLKCSASKLDLFWFLYCCSAYCGNGARYSADIVGKQKADLARATRTERILYDYVDVEARFKAEREKREKQATAIQKVKDMSENKLRQVYASFEQPEAETENIDKIYSFLYDVAEKQPEKMIAVKFDDISILATVQKARQMNVIRFVKQTRAWKFADEQGDEVICLATRGKNEVDELVNWLRTSDDNGEVLKALIERTSVEKEAV